jgi:hypothetical protein
MHENLSATGRDHGVRHTMNHAPEPEEKNQAGHDHDMSGMAVAATLHCLTGCSIGEIVGLILGTSFGWHTVLTTAVSIILAFLFGYALSAVPLLRAGIPAARALTLVLAADTLSITVMEIVDNAVMLLIPGAMNAGLLNPVFWLSMALSLVVAFTAALPVNRALLRRGRGHAITHAAMGHGGGMDNRPLVIGLSAFMLGGFVASLGGLL